ncbi:MAG: hypothetical protein IPO92_17910 [Saprospiraceae bacterium]|nr:hypothetical protein [Saprospiraceae bacterium]
MLRATILFIFSLCQYFVVGQFQMLLNESSPEVKFREEQTNIDYKVILTSVKNLDVRNAVVIELPLFNNKKQFRIVKNKVMSDDLNKLYPDLMTFDLMDENNIPVGSLTTAGFGIYAFIYSFGMLVIIKPLDYSGGNMHTISYGQEPEADQLKAACGVNGQFEKLSFNHNKKPFFGGNRNDFELGEKLLGYDLAIVCTGEFYVANGNNNAAVTAVITKTVNDITAIYKKDMSITLNVSAARIRLYSDPDTDPFIPDDTGGGAGRTEQAGMAVNMNFPNVSSYDIGHVFHTHKNGDGWSNGGVAGLETVCDDFILDGAIFKGRGWSGSFSNGNYGWIQLASHEFGHQFGATHTFNGTGGSCTDAISENTAVEIGSGTTIMSYDNSCDAIQNIPSAEQFDNYFHGATLQQMAIYIYFDEGGTCATIQNSNNAIPQVLANPCNAQLNLPKGTPFYLNGVATDANDQGLSYTWEQIDEDGEGVTTTQGLIGSSAGNSTIAPLFRSFPPSDKTERYFPSLPLVTSNTPDLFEVLPNVARQMKFLLTVRDNNVNGSAVGSEQVTLNVNNSGPFRVSRPIGGETLLAGQNELITWNTNGSNGLCSKVRIKISIDGGLSYPIVIAENVSYALGSYTYAMPPGFVKTQTARVMIECMDYDCFKFFNISTSNFSVNSSCVAPATEIMPDGSVIFDQGDPGLMLNLKSNIGSLITLPITGSINQTETIRTTSKATVVCGTNTCSLFSGGGDDFFFDQYIFRVSVSGVYTFTPTSNFSHAIALYQGSFNPNSQCSNLLGSSRCFNLPNTISGLITPISVNLSPGIDYTLTSSNYFFNTQTGNYTINVTVPSGGGLYNGIVYPLDMLILISL